MARDAPNEVKRLAKVDDETNAIIYQGASINIIARIFKKDPRDIRSKIVGHVAPVGIRANQPIYEIKDVAPYLVSPPYDIDEFIQRMSLADLPTVMRKEFWAGMRSRQLYEKEAAEVWETSQVVDAIASLLKTLRMSLLLARESAERETDLSPTQRQIVTKIIDNALEDAHRTVEQHFTLAKQRASEHAKKHEEGRQQDVADEDDHGL